MKKLFDLCVPTRKYKSKGQEKTNWENIGALIQNDDGKKFIMLKAHFNPAAIQRKEGSESIVISMFAPKIKQDNSDLSQRSSQWDDNDNNFGAVDNDDGIPF